MLAYGWPGNVRELEHVISRAAVKLLSRGASRTQILTLEAELLDLDSSVEQPAAIAPTPVHETAQTGVGALRESVENCQRQSIQQALEAFAGNWASAARALDLDPSNLHKLARRLGLK
jgi:anaerobic nitric oxide reductase transcription regulator